MQEIAHKKEMNKMVSIFFSVNLLFRFYILQWILLR